MMDNKIYFSIPGFHTNFMINYCLVNLFNSERYKFYDDVVIDSVYDNLPCIWNGGRRFAGNYDIIDVMSSVAFFNINQISARLVFTNSLITDEHISDVSGNSYLRMFENTGFENLHNGVTLSTAVLKDYVVNKYPEYYTVWSTTLCELDIDKINKLSQDNITVLDYRLNNDFDSIKQLKHPENIEVLCGEMCTDNCPYKEEHYKATDKNNMGIPVEESQLQCKFLLPGTWFHYYLVASKRRHWVTIDDIREKYLPLGINKFKISGRGDPTSIVVEKYVDYLVKPEYRDEIRRRLLDENNKWWDKNDEDKARSGIKEKYWRNIPLISMEQQKSLENKSVLIVGCGGLGGNVVEELSRIGVGRITVIDGDTFDESNLNRQLFCTSENLGSYKVDAALERIKQINPDVNLEVINRFVPISEMASFIKEADVVVDAVDDINYKLNLGDICGLEGVTVVYGAARAWAFDVGVSNQGAGMLYDLYRNVVGKESRSLNFDACLNPIAASCASLMALEVIKVLLGQQSKLLNHIYIQDYMAFESYII